MEPERYTNGPVFHTDFFRAYIFFFLTELRLLWNRWR